MPRNSLNKKNKNIRKIFFFFSSVLITCLIVIGYITMKNECLLVQREISHLKNIHNGYSNKLIMYESEMQNLLRRESIESEARRRIGMTFPAPESLVVFVDFNNE